MLPSIIDMEAGDHIAMVDKNNDRLNMLFASREALRDNPFRPHWVRECGDERTLKAMTRWFAARRNRWDQWGELAEEIGANAFWRHMEALLASEPLEQVVGAILSPLEDAQEIELGEMLLGTQGHRSETLCIHRFASAAARERFFDWLYTDSNFDRVEPLLDIGWRAGTIELGRSLDEIAAQSTDVSANAPRGRRRGRSRRSVRA